MPASLLGTQRTGRFPTLYALKGDSIKFSIKFNTIAFHECPCSVRRSFVNSPRMDGNNQRMCRRTYAATAHSRRQRLCLQRMAGACMQVEPWTITVCQKTLTACFRQEQRPGELNICWPLPHSATSKKSATGDGITRTFPAVQVRVWVSRRQQCSRSEGRKDVYERAVSGRRR